MEINLAYMFTVEEMNAVALYHSKSRNLTIIRMQNASEYILDDGLYIVFMSAIKKLKKISDDDFANIDFMLTR